MLIDVRSSSLHPWDRFVSMLIEHSLSSSQRLIDHSQLRNTVDHKGLARRNGNTLNASSFFHVSHIVKRIANLGIVILFVMIWAPPNPTIGSRRIDRIQQLRRHTYLNRSNAKFIKAIEHGIAKRIASVDKGIGPELRLKRFDLVHICSGFDHKHRRRRRSGIGKSILKSLLNCSIGVRRARLQQASTLVTSIGSHV